MRLSVVVVLFALVGCGVQAPPMKIPQPSGEKAAKTVLVTAFEVPEEAHDHFRNELKLWPKKIADASKKEDAVRFVASAKGAPYVLGGKLEATKTEVKITAWLRDTRSRERVWSSDAYTLKEFPQKVKFVDDTREKIVAEVKKFLKE